MFEGMRHLPLGLALGLALLAVTAGAQRAPGLSGAEQIDTAGRYVARMKEIQVRVNQLAAQARKRKDIIQLNCINDKLQQLKGNLAVAEQSLATLAKQSTQADEAARNHEFAKTSLTHQKALVLAQEAETCIGEELRYAGATEVDVTVDPNVPQEDPTEPPEEPTELERAPVASPP